MTRPPLPAGLDADRLQVWASVATLLERLPAALDAQLQRDSGLTHFEHGLLFALGTTPGRTLRLSTLAGYTNCTLSRLSRAITRLENRSLVRRETDPDDGRASLAILTDDGHRLLQESTPAHHALVEKLVFAPLSEAQVHQLGAITRAINAAIDPAGAWTPPASGAPER